MAFVQIWIHAVWGTKNRESILTEDLVVTICNHIQMNAKQHGFYIDVINGFKDHIHCLMALRSDWSVAKQMQMIKGEAAFWVNSNKLIKNKLEWADEYFAASVSVDKLDVVRAYIRNQVEHHRKISFAEEYKRFVEAYKMVDERSKEGMK